MLSTTRVGVVTIVSHRESRPAVPSASAGGRTPVCVSCVIPVQDEPRGTQPWGGRTGICARMCASQRSNTARERARRTASGTADLSQSDGTCPRAWSDATSSTPFARHQCSKARRSAIGGELIPRRRTTAASTPGESCLPNGDGKTSRTEPRGWTLSRIARTRLTKGTPRSRPETDRSAGTVQMRLDRSNSVQRAPVASVKLAAVSAMNS